MEKKSVRVDFDKDNDIISLFIIGKRSKFSFDLELPKGDIVVDYGFNGEIVGLEIFNASEYIPLLKKIKSNARLRGRLSVQYGQNWAQVSFVLSAPGLKNPISNSINAPYNRQIILKH